MVGRPRGRRKKEPVSKAKKERKLVEKPVEVKTPKVVAKEEPKEPTLAEKVENLVKKLKEVSGQAVASQVVDEGIQVTVESVVKFVVRKVDNQLYRANEAGKANKSQRIGDVVVVVEKGFEYDGDAIVPPGKKAQHGYGGVIE